MIVHQTYKNGELVETITHQTSVRVKSVLGPMPFDQWPMWAKAFKQLASAKDSGVGDTIAQLIGPETSEAFKVWHLKIFGRPCGCSGRHKRLNFTYPYDHLPGIKSDTEH